MMENRVSSGSSFPSTCNNIIATLSLFLALSAFIVSLLDKTSTCSCDGSIKFLNEKMYNLDSKTDELAMNIPSVNKLVQDMKAMTEKFAHKIDHLENTTDGTGSTISELNHQMDDVQAWINEISIDNGLQPLQSTHTMREQVQNINDTMNIIIHKVIPAMDIRSKLMNVTVSEMHRHVSPENKEQINQLNSSVLVLANNLKKIVSKCPSNFILSPLEDTCYKLEFQPMTWSLAQSYCELLGGWLVTVNDAAEHFTLSRFQKDFFLKSSVWIGLSDFPTEGSMRWTHTGSNYGYVGGRYPWAIGQPDNAGNNEDCVALYDDVSGQLGSFNDWPCDKTFKFICETDMLLS